MSALYVPKVLTALRDWQHYRLYLALDTTVLWNRALYDSPVSRLLWASYPVTVARIRTQQCNCRQQASTNRCYVKPAGCYVIMGM